MRPLRVRMTMRSLRESLPLKWSNGRAGCTCAMCLTIWGHIITFSARKQHNIMYIYRVSNVYLSYIFRVCIEIYSGLQAAKVQLFCDICKRKGHFLSKKGKKTPKMSGYMNKKHSRYPLIAKIGTALQVTEKCYTRHRLHPH